MKKAWNKASRVISALLVLGMFASVVPAQALAVDEPNSQVEQQDEEQTVEEPSVDVTTTEGNQQDETTTEEPSVDKTVTEEKSEDETTTEEQPKDETTTEEQPKDETTTEEQPQDQEVGSLLKSPQAKMGGAAPLTLGFIPYKIKNKTDKNLDVDFSFAYQYSSCSYPISGEWAAGETKTFWDAIPNVTTLAVFVKVPDGYEPEFYFDGKPAEDGDYSAIEALPSSPGLGLDIDISDEIQAAQQKGYQWGFYYTWWTAEFCRNFEVKLNPISYQISYQLNDGYWADGTEAKESYTADDLGENGLPLATPEREGYEFAGWTQDGVTGAPKTDMTIAPGTTGNLSFTAHWNVAINFDSNGGSAVEPLKGYTGKTITDEMPSPERAGYTFEGWYDENGNEVTSLPENFSNYNVTYTAKWAKRTDLKYTINYYKDSIAEGNLLKSVSGTGTLDASIPYVSGEALPDGYTTSNVQVSGATTIGVEADKNVLNVVYGRRTDLSYTVYYIEDQTGRTLAGPDTVGGQTYGANITVWAKDIPGYTLTSDKNPQVVNIGTGENTLRFLYKEVGPDQPVVTPSDTTTPAVAAAPVTPRITTPAAGGTTTAGTTGPAVTAAPADGDGDNAAEEPAEEEVVPEEETPQAQEPADESIADEETPLAGNTASGWALLNLILAIVTAIGAIVLVVGYFMGYTSIWRLLSLVPGIGGVVAFFLTEDMSQAMTFVDSWTVLMVIIAVVQIVVAVMALKANGEDEEDA